MGELTYLKIMQIKSNYCTKKLVEKKVHLRKNILCFAADDLLKDEELQGSIRF